MKSEWALKIADAIQNWLGKEDSVISKHFVQVINTEGWFCATNKIEVLYNFFKSPLENARHKGTVSAISK